MDERIEPTKADLKNRIVAGTAKGITGVGIDRDLEKLIVFYRDHEQARETMKSLSHGFVEFLILEDGSLPDEDDDVGEDLADQERLPLAPSQVIKAENGGRGRIGCFVESEGDTAALTSAHIFHLQVPGQDVLVRRSRPNDFVLIGKTLRFPILLPPPGHSNRADAALFLPDPAKVTLQHDPRIRGDFFKQSDLVTVERKLARNLTNNVAGMVQDVTALIAYDVTIAGILHRNVVFDDQVLIKNQSGSQIFGQKSQSGSLVIKAGPPDQGKAVGIYSYVTKNRQYHFATPFFACASELGIDRILNP